MPIRSDRRIPWLVCLIAPFLALVSTSLLLAGNGSLVENADGDGDLSLFVNFDIPPDPDRLDTIKAAFSEAGSILCDATDGQVKLRQVTLTGGIAARDGADIRMVRDHCTSMAELLGLGVRDAYITLCYGQQTSARVIAHEVAHLAFGVSDQYPNNRRTGIDLDQPGHGQYLCPVGPGFEPDDMTPTRHTMMQGGAYYDCSQEPCALEQASELSVFVNHDRQRGDPMGECPPHLATTRVEVTEVSSIGRLVEPKVFDPTSFESAAATSHARSEIALRDSVGTVQGVELYLYWTVEEPIRDAGDQVVEDRVLLVAAIDIKRIDPNRWGELVEVGRWTLDFATGELVVTDGGELRVDIAGLLHDADDLDVVLDLSLLQGIPFGDTTTIPLAADGFLSCGLPDCAARWDAESQTWASTQHSMHNNFKSDWTVLHENFRFIEPPDIGDEPIAEAPAHCAELPEFVEEIHGSDQTFLVLDRSGSMNDPATGLPGREVCDNGLDDDEDGQIDEAVCSQSRLSFLHAAARAFIDLQIESDMEIGLVSFARDVDPLAPLAEIDEVTAAAYKGLVDQLEGGGRTAIGDALAASRDLLLDPEHVGNRQSVVLISDGMNNEGAEPEVVSPTLRDAGIQVFTIPAGGASDREALAELAAETGGAFYPTETFDDLHALYAEIAARLAGHGLLVQRERLSVAKEPWLYASKDPGAEPVTDIAEIALPVEHSAKRLTVFLGGRNERMETWAPAFELKSPGGQSLGPGSPGVRTDPFYRTITVDGPEAGTWWLRMWSGDGALQRLVVTASVYRPDVAFLADAQPRLVFSGKPVELSATPSVSVPLDSAGVEVHAVVRGPDGVETEVDLAPDPFSGRWSGWFDDAIFRGRYEVTYDVSVVDDAVPLAGEPIFDGPERAAIDVPAFVRTADASFVVVDGPFIPCQSSDCDGDGVPNSKECKGDVDGDGWPAFLDPDADGDDVGDWIEGTVDLDGNGLPDACDPYFPKPK